MDIPIPKLSHYQRKKSSRLPQTVTHTPLPLMTIADDNKYDSNKNNKNHMKVLKSTKKKIPTNKLSEYRIIGGVRQPPRPSLKRVSMQLSLVKSNTQTYENIESDYDSADSFIDTSSDIFRKKKKQLNGTTKYISKTYNKDAAESEEAMEVSFAQQQMEELYSAKVAKMEDAKEYELIKEERRNEEELRKFVKQKLG